jgi:hypothetical protein
VGVPRGTVLGKSGDRTITRDGAVINGLSVSGSIIVQANNVTIRNSRITASGGFAIHEPNGYGGLTVKDSEVSGGDIYAGGGKGAMNTFARLYMHDCGECIQYDASITDSYFYVSGHKCHCEAIYDSDGTVNVQHTTFMNPHEQTADVFMDVGSPGQACDDHLTINNSLLAGGGYMVYPCGEAGSAGSSTTVITNNRFGRCTTKPTVRSAGGYICQGHGSPTGDGEVIGSPDSNGYYPYGGFFGVDSYTFCAQTTWTNNVWDDNGATVSC